MKRRHSSGSYKLQCDRSGMWISSKDAVVEWNGKVVYKRFAEQRNAQDFVRVPSETAVPNHPRLENQIATTPYGIGSWAINRTFVIAPDGTDPKTDPVGFETWFNTVWTTKIKPQG